MATYDGAEAVYDELGGALRRVLADPARLARLQSADAIVRLDLRDPDAKLTCLARIGAPGVLATGETDVKPDLVLSMEADMLRGLMFGERTPLTALIAGEIGLKGPVAKLLRVMEALSSASAEPPADGEPEAPAGGEAQTTAGGEPESSDASVAAADAPQPDDASS